MKITFTAAALEKIEPLLAQENKILKFVHDTEGCGCAMNGVPALKLIDEPTINDSKGIADPLPFYYDKTDKILYEEHLKIDFKVQTHSLILKSDSQIYSSNLRIIR